MPTIGSEGVVFSHERGTPVNHTPLNPIPMQAKQKKGEKVDMSQYYKDYKVPNPDPSTLNLTQLTVDPTIETVVTIACLRPLNPKS